MILITQNTIMAEKIVWQNGVVKAFLTEILGKSWWTVIVNC